MKAVSLCLAFFAFIAVQSAVAAPTQEPSWYWPRPGIAGNLSSIGSDTLAKPMQLWAQEFRRLYPNVNIQLQASGSASAPVALIEGTASLGPMSRPMTEREQMAFQRRFGYAPTRITVAIDALAVFVHQDNPLPGLNLDQLDRIFSATRRCSGAAPITHWQQLGLDGLLAPLPLELHGRNGVSGTYAFFRASALCRGDFSLNVNEHPGSASVVQSVGAALNAIGYSSINYQTASTRALPLAYQGSQFVAPSAENFISGQYPLARQLYIYINRPPGKALPPLVHEFLRLTLSRDGQQLVRRAGYTPLPEAAVWAQLRTLNDAH